MGGRHIPVTRSRQCNRSCSREMTKVALPSSSRVTSLDRRFRTDHLDADLNRRSVRAGAITVSAQAVKFILNLASTAVLARLLTPADFGLVAMVAAFAGFLGLFSDMGLLVATI